MKADPFELLRSLALPTGDFAVFGSGPLLIRGILTEVNDLDVVCRGAAWSRAIEVGELVTLAEDGAQIVSCFDSIVTIGRSWAYGEFDIDALIDSAELIDGLPFVRLEHVVEYKRIARRPKDLAHLALFEQYENRRARGD